MFSIIQHKNILSVGNLLLLEIIDYCLKYVDFQNKRVMQHTAGEKRMSAHPDHSYLRYRRSASQKKINILTC